MTDDSQGAALTANLAILGEGLAFDASTQTLTLPADADRTGVQAIFSMPAAANRAERKFLLTLTELPASGGVVTVFNSAAALRKMDFVANTPPTWSLNDGFGRMEMIGNSRAHGDWIEAGGDGLYRCLVRWSGAGMAYSLARRFSFGARVNREGARWTGLRVDAYRTAAGVPSLQVRDYVDENGATTVLSTATVAWEFDVWQWVEVEVVGTSVRARLYPELATAPDWQISATTTQTGAGAFGPGGFPALGESPIIDVRRIEFTPAAR